MSGKGDKRRPKQISDEEEDLRWELFRTKNKKRREELLKRIAELQNERAGKTR